MSPHNQFSAVIWNFTDGLLSCQIEIDHDRIKISEGAAPTTHSQVYITSTSGSIYSLGQWIFKGQYGFRIEQSVFEATTLIDSTSLVEQSALNRLKNVLQGQIESEITLISKNARILAVTKPLTESPKGDFFLCRLKSGLKVSSEYLHVTSNIKGMSFAFKSKIIGQEQDLIALSLPETAIRILSRTVPRTSSSTKVILRTKRDELEAAITNISHLGACITTFSINSICKWEEVEIEIPGSSKTPSLNIKALVVGTNNSRIHLLFAGRSPDIKSRFYSINQMYDDMTELEENPEFAWHCLSQFGYQELLDSTETVMLKTKCLDSWNKIKKDFQNFFPVAIIDGSPVGTIAAAELADDHWVPHSLAAKVQPSAMAATFTLYMAWPMYLLSLAKQLWASTWYDNNKPWHNRFYQVFIKEHEGHPGVRTLVRHWCKGRDLEIQPIPKRFLFTFFDELTSSEQAAVRAQWKVRFKNKHESPLFTLESKDHYIFTEQTVSIRFDDQVIAVAKIINSNTELNPMNVFRSVHLYLMNREYKVDGSLMHDLVLDLTSFVKQLGMDNCTLTLDFDFPLNSLENTKFTAFSQSRCLSTVSSLLPSLISNNALSFSDMQTRHGQIK